MYAWIWRKLPFGLAGKLTGSVLLAAAAVALLWYVVFPWAEPLLPFDDVQVTQDAGTPDAPAGGDAVERSAPGPNDHDVPYETTGDSSPTSSADR